MSLRAQPAAEIADDIVALADTIPAALVALEIQRRRVKAVTVPGGCRYRLYLAEKKFRQHPWLVERMQDWRTARKALKYAADRVEKLRNRRTAPRHGADPDF